MANPRHDSNSSIIVRQRNGGNENVAMTAKIARFLALSGDFSAFGMLSTALWRNCFEQTA